MNINQDELIEATMTPSNKPEIQITPDMINSAGSLISYFSKGNNGLEIYTKSTNVVKVHNFMTTHMVYHSSHNMT